MKNILLTGILFSAFCLAPPLAAGEDLVSIYHLASEHDPEIRAAAAARDATLESENISRAGYRPSVSLSGDITSQHQSIKNGTTDTFTTNGYTLSLTQAIYNRDALLARRQSREESAKAEAEYQAARQALILRVAESYFDVLAAQDSLEFAEAEKNAIARQLEQTQQRFNVGLIAITDVHEAQARYDLALAQEIAASNVLDNAKEQLRVITNHYHTALGTLVEDTPLPAPDPANIEQWVQTALEQNLNLIAMQRSVAAAQQALKRQDGQRQPVLNLVGSHRHTDTTDSNYFGNETDNSAIALQLSWKFYQGGAISAATRQAQHLLDQTLESYEQQRRLVERQTRNAYLGVLAGISRVKALKQARVSSQSALDATEAGLEVGTRTTVDVLNAQQELFRARRDYARARYDYILDTLRLKQAAGIMAVNDLEHINNWLK